MPDTVKINLTIIDPSLSDEELQSQVQFLLPQIREVEGVETVALTKRNLPDGTKAGGNFLVGSFYATVNILKLRPIWTFIGSKISGKIFEVSVEHPDGRKFSAKASSKEDIEYLRKQAEEFCRQ